jgi:hypothetical protein
MNNELGGSFDTDAKDVFAVKSKALTSIKLLHNT